MGHAHLHRAAGPCVPKRHGWRTRAQYAFPTSIPLTTHRDAPSAAEELVSGAPLLITARRLQPHAPLRQLLRLIGRTRLIGELVGPCAKRDRKRG